MMERKLRELAQICVISAICVQNKKKMNMSKQMYVKPTLTLYRVELEKSIVADGSSPVATNIVLDGSSLTWGEEIQLGEVHDADEGGDIEMSW
jgi:hypothetical protein